uniref:NADH-ubiquinone oxidoreductase chain 6 n=1 Tax=Iphiteon panicea TaxID=436082 RepID=A6YHK1_9METZ|nr:NADH dehydrogenase subunit 6 [Iphiteon panicea]
MSPILCTNILITTIIIATTNSTIYSAVWLILTFINISLLFILLEIEFIAILLIIVYAGAIAILFLFAIMMLNLHTKEQTSDSTHLLPINATIIISVIIIGINSSSHKLYNTTPQIKTLDNTETISSLLYSNYTPWFLISSIILLISMIATIVIIQKEQINSIKQQLFKQQNKTNLT